MQPKEEMSWVYLYQKFLRKVLEKKLEYFYSMEKSFLKNHSECQHLKIWHCITSLLSICPRGQPHRQKVIRGQSIL